MDIWPIVLIFMFIVIVALLAVIVELLVDIRSALSAQEAPLADETDIRGL